MEVSVQTQSIDVYFEHIFGYIISNPRVLLFCLASFAISALLIPLIIKVCSKYKLYDTTGGRKIHSGNIPRLGSIGFVFAYSIVSLVYAFYVHEALKTTIPFVVSGFIIFVFGLLDDIFNLRALLKLAVQVVASLLIVFSGFYFRSIGGILLPQPVSIVLTVLWIIGIINAFNLIDGMDGLCGGISCMIVFTLSIIYSVSANHAATMCLILACALLGFLLYNKPKAKIFMGDGGSQFLGFMIATLPLYRTTENFEYNKFFIMIVLVSIPLMDCIAAIWRRTREHRSIMSADRAHLHHKLLYLGLTVKQALFMLLLLQFCLCVISCIAMYLRGYNAVVLMLTALLFMAIIFSMIHFFYRKRMSEKGDKDF